MSSAGMQKEDVEPHLRSTTVDSSLVTGMMIGGMNQPFKIYIIFDSTYEVSVNDVQNYKNKVSTKL